jgi:hypothetical protein
VGTAFKTIQTDDWYRRGRRERLLGEISGIQLTHSGTAGFPIAPTLHPRLSLDETRKQVSGHTGGRERRGGRMRGVGSSHRDRPGPTMKGRRCLTSLRDKE